MSEGDVIKKKKKKTETMHQFGNGFKSQQPSKGSFDAFQSLRPNQTPFFNDVLLVSC